jgi:hypothetical protein
MQGIFTLSYAMVTARYRSNICFNTRSYLFSPLSLLRFSFLDEYINDSGFAKNKGYSVMHGEEIKERVAAAAAQVTDPCKGLLELRQTGCDRAGGEFGCLHPRVYPRISGRFSRGNTIEPR